MTLPQQHSEALSEERDQIFWPTKKIKCGLHNHISTCVKANDTDMVPETKDGILREDTAKFSNKEDYDYVLTQGPWLVRDNYLTIRKWVPNFISNEELIRHLSVRIRIPHLSVEYLNEGFLWLIGVKVCKVLKVDDTIAHVERGKDDATDIEFDLESNTKTPLENEMEGNITELWDDASEN
ncbi:hypothetical protein Cgig2_020662 [Carnegiea gigantea]|uniref:DUF4283 domain-containing protein n=1 Tax=Carnegiea gigantea TaxID=171969 RepID=A0A9Q1KIK0_9CARY|nr:hypothetical protein Cgig2_020662 [Carnegiea gigantea]